MYDSPPVDDDTRGDSGSIAHVTVLENIIDAAVFGGVVLPTEVAAAPPTASTAPERAAGRPTTRSGSFNSRHTVATCFCVIMVGVVAHEVQSERGRDLFVRARSYPINGGRVPTWWQ